MLRPENESDLSCDVCNKSTKNSVLYGDFYLKKTKSKITDVKAHYFCLLFSNNIHQKGKPTGGILGFLVKDIKVGINQTKSETCYYCKEPSATITCAHESCNKKFHFICGFTHQCLYIFKDDFKSFCSEHHGIEPSSNCHSDEDICHICMEHMGTYNVLQSITSKCCTDINWWMHRRCVMDYAVSAGYYLKCIFCLNVNFREDIKSMGVYVPDRDAEWERVKGAYSELLNKNIFCDVKTCYCPKSRNFTKNGKWKLLKCQLCAATGTHKGCSGITSDKYECFQCRSILYKRNIIDSVEIGANDDISFVDVSLRQEKLLSRTFNNDIPCIDLVSDSSDLSISDIWEEMDAEAARGPILPIVMPQPKETPYKYPPQLSLTQEQQQEAIDRMRNTLGMPPKSINEL